MVNEAGHFPEVCKKSLQAMAADMQGAITPEFWSTYSAAAAAGLLAARAGIVRPARRSRCCYTRGERLLPADLVGRRARPHRRQAEAARARRNVLVLQRPQQQRGRLSAAALRPPVRHEQRQQLQLLLPPGQRRRPGQRHSAAARPRSRWKTSSTPTWCSSSAATRPATIRG